MDIRRIAALGSSALVLGLSPGCSESDGDGDSCSSYRETQYIPSQTALVFERDDVTVEIIGDPLRRLAVIVTSSDGEYDQTRIEGYGELFEGIELGTKFGMDWVSPGVQAPGQVSPALRVYDCWEVVEAPPDVF